MRLCRILVCGLLIFFGAWLEAQSKVALTFDDLPRHGDLPPGLTRVEVAQKILATLKAHHVVQAYGFINAQRAVAEPETKEVLTVWRAAGYPLGNHTYTHMDLDSNSVDAFEADVTANEAMLKSLMPGSDWHWFRYPFLHEGNTPEKHNAVRSFLLENGYQIAQVTLDFEDYAWNGPYARCSAKNDTEALKWLEESYMATAAEYISLGQQQSKLVFGRDIPHVMLLHIGGFETVMLPRLLDYLEQKGFTFVPLGQAESDPAYKANPAPLQAWDETFFSQLMEARKIPVPAHAEKPMEKLRTLCQ